MQQAIPILERTQAQLPRGTRPLSREQAQLALLPDDEIVVNGIPGRFVKWGRQEGRDGLVMRTRYREPRLAGCEVGNGRTPLYMIDAGRALHLSLPCAQLPGFDELTRCNWGTHVTVLGQPARFNQAGMVDGRQVVVVLAYGANPVLHAASWRDEPAGGGEIAYYFDYHRTGLRIGTPRGAPLMPEQADRCLRSGDLVLVNGLPQRFQGLTCDDDAFWLALASRPGLLQWTSGVRLRLLSARLPTFADLSRLKPGTPVTIGADAIPGVLHKTIVRDGTRECVVVSAPPRLALRQAASQPQPNGTQWLYRIRFQEAGLRLADDFMESDFDARAGQCV